MSIQEICRRKFLHHFSDIQNRLDNILHAKLNEVGDEEIRDRHYYMDLIDFRSKRGKIYIQIYCVVNIAKIQTIT